MERQFTGSTVYKKALEITWLAVIFLVPLFFNPQSYLIFSVAKISLLQFLVVAMLAFWIADWMLNRAGDMGLRWQNIFNSPLHLAILGFGFVATIATVASITPAISFWGDWERKAGLLTLICWILFFLLVAQQIRTRTQLLRAVYTLLLSSGIVSIVGILQHLFPDIMLNVLIIKYTGRVFSTIGNPLFLSSFLAMVIPFTLALMVYSWYKRKEKNNTRILISLVILLALQLWCLWLAQYSITILLYIIAPIIFIILLGIIKRKRLVLSLGAVSLLALVVIAGLLLAPLLLSDTRIETPGPEDLKSAPLSENLGLQTLGMRTQFWKGIIDMFFESPEVPFSNDRLHFLRKFIGYGPETFTFTFQSFYPDNLKSFDTYRLIFQDRPHNDYLYLATTMGLLGLTSFLAILGVFFYLCFKYMRQARADIDKLLLTAMAAAMVQYMADIFFNLSTISPELVLWLTLSFVAVFGRLTTDREPEQTKIADLTKLDASHKSYVNKTRRYVAAGCALLLILAGVGITIRPFLADMYLQKGVNLEARRSQQTVLAYDKATKLAPGEAFYWHFLGLYEYSVARAAKEEAIKADILTLSTNALEKTRELEPYIAYWNYTLADVYTYWANTGAVDKWSAALSLYDKASQLFPDNAVILNKWSLALIIKGDLDEARTKLDYTASIDPGWAETSFLYGLLLAREGKNDEAVSKLITPIQDNPANLNYFIVLCHRIMIYDMASSFNSSLDSYTQELPDDWIAHALLGTTSLFDGNLDKSLDEFNTSMLLVPSKDAGQLFRATLNLSTMSPQFKAALPGVAAEWRAKLAQSPENETLLPQLDKLVGTSQ
jgi:O-antigen ligase/tetratricopeptide (TPR) repeat protein